MPWASYQMLLLGASLRDELVQILLVDLLVGPSRAELLSMQHDGLLCCAAHCFKLQIGSSCGLDGGVCLRHVLLLLLLLRLSIWHVVEGVRRAQSGQLGQARLPWVELAGRGRGASVVALRGRLLRDQRISQVERARMSR